MNVQKINVFSYAGLSTVFPKVLLCAFRMINILIALFLVACVSPHSPAPIRHSVQPDSQSQAVHYVKKGETLYSIAWQYGLDYKALAANNNIGSDYRIYAGQRLSLNSQSVLSQPPKKTTQSKPKPSKTTAKTIGNSQETTSREKEPKPQSRSNKQSAAIVSNSADRQKNGVVRWYWPASGLVVTNFFSGDAKGKGIDIAGEKGDSVNAAAKGKVVYAGDGLRGYGNLVIIRHSAEYLSAYAYNDVILVKEGQQVNVGEKIAELGSTGTGAKNREVLHFQIRKNGKPINPVPLLPKR